MELSAIAVVRAVAFFTPVIENHAEQWQEYKHDRPVEFVVALTYRDQVVNKERTDHGVYPKQYERNHQRHSSARIFDRPSCSTFLIGLSFGLYLHSCRLVSSHFDHA